MIITDVQVERFQTLYSESFGIELSFEQAQAIGLSLLNLVHHTYQPITKQQFKETKLRKQTISNN